MIISYAVRLDYGPDEPAHMEYVHLLAREGRLPEPWDSTAGHHGPVPYLLLVPFYRLSGCTLEPLRLPPGPKRLATFTAEEVRARRVLRLVCLFEAFLAVVCIYYFAVRLFPQSRPLALLLSGAVAFNPVYTLTAGVVNNEQASIVLSTVASGLMLLAWREGELSWRRCLALGALCGLGLWVKQTTIFLLPLALFSAWRLSPPERRVRHVLCLLGLFLALGVWWPLHHVLKGRGPFPVFMPVPEWQDNRVIYWITHPMLTLAVVHTIATTSLLSAILPDWAFRGPFQLLTRSHFGLLVFALLCLVALGYALYATQAERRKKPPRDQPLIPRHAIALGLAALCIIIAGIVWFALRRDYRGQVGGRYLFNGALWGALIAVGSFERWVLTFARTRRAVDFAALAAWALFIALDAVWVWYAVTYYRALAVLYGG